MDSIKLSKRGFTNKPKTSTLTSRASSFLSTSVQASRKYNYTENLRRLRHACLTNHRNPRNEQPIDTKKKEQNHLQFEVRTLYHCTAANSTTASIHKQAPFDDQNFNKWRLRKQSRRPVGFTVGWYSVQCEYDIVSMR